MRLSASELLHTSASALKSFHRLVQEISFFFFFFCLTFYAPLAWQHPSVVSLRTFHKNKTFKSKKSVLLPEVCLATHSVLLLLFLLLWEWSGVLRTSIEQPGERVKEPIKELRGRKGRVTQGRASLPSKRGRHGVVMDVSPSYSTGSSSIGSSAALHQKQQPRVSVFYTPTVTLQ